LGGAGRRPAEHALKRLSQRSSVPPGGRRRMCLAVRTVNLPYRMLSIRAPSRPLS